MAMSARGKRRLAIVLAVVVVLTGALTGLYLIRQSQHEQRAQAARQAGMAAYENGDLRAALENLRVYLNRHGEDVEARYTHAMARLRLPEPGGRNISPAVRSLQRVVELDPDHPQAASDLLELHMLQGNDSQALALADEILARQPRNLPAIRARAAALTRLERTEQAIETTRSGLEIDPLDWRLHLRHLQLQKQLGASEKELLDQAQALSQQHPEDPRFEMLEAFAFGVAGQVEQMREKLAAAAQRTPPDDAFVASLQRFLDEVGMYEESLALLQRAAAPESEGGLYEELIQRLFEARQFQEVADRLSSADPADAAADPALPAIHAMALFELGQTDEAQQIVNHLAQQHKSPAAQAWANVLGAVYTHTGSGQATRVITAVQTSLGTYAGNAYFHYFLGRGYMQAGEPQFALPAWERAGQLRPSWAAPHLLRARLLLSQGQNQRGLEAAEAAFARQRNNLEAAIVLVSARAAVATAGETDQEQVDEVLHMIDEVQALAPGEEQTLLLRVGVLAKAGRHDDAAAAARDLIDGDPAISEQGLLHLAKLSERYNLDAGQAIHDQLAAAPSNSSDVALAQARQLAAQGEAPRGQQLLEQGLANAQTAQEKLGWRVAIAHYLETLNDPAAADAWIAIADDHPDDARVQQMALQRPVTASDREFTNRAIERLRSALGQNSLVWRLARAKWLLNAPPQQRDPGQASSLLRDVISQAPDEVQPRLLLAQAQEQLGLLPLAVRELRAAAELQPESHAITLELARLNQSMRHFRSAREELDQVINSPAATDQERRQAGAMLARQGAHDQALAVFEQLAADEGRRSNEDRLMLAHLYQRTGQLDKAQQVVRDLLSEPTPGTIAFAAYFYATIGDQKQVEEVLAMANRLPFEPGQREALFAEHHARIGQPDQAIAHYRQAVEAAPQDAMLWQRLISLELLQSDVTAALADARRAAKEVPGDPAINRLLENDKLLRTLKDDPRARPLMASLLQEAGVRTAALDALRLLAAARDSGEPLIHTARRLQPLADQNPGALELQKMLAQLYLDAGRPDEAASVAMRAMESFPTAVEPAWLATEALAAADRWDQALLVAQQWRQRSATQALRADMMIAEASLHLGEANNAIRAIQPYLDQALANPDAHPDVVTSYVRSLIAAGRYDQAAQVLRPLLSQSADWRAQWMRLAGLALPNAEDAQNWLREVSDYVDTQNTDEVAALARSWWVLAERLDISAAREQAKHIIGELVQQPRVPAAAWYLHGVMADETGDIETAIASYRRALAGDPNMAVAQNNLAMLIADDPVKVEEAVTLAKQAVATQSDNPHFLDTLATVEAKAGNCEAAIEHMERAIQLDPANPAWRENLVRILAACGREDQASQLLKTMPVAVE